MTPLNPKSYTAFIIRFILLWILILATTGCTTFRTISEADSDSAKIFSGTRLNIRAINGDTTQTKKFTTYPSSDPIADLPFSFALDILILPITCGVALYETVFR